MVRPTQMWLGLFLAMGYTVWGFGPVGEPPKIAVTFGPFRNGHLMVSGYHVHHWMVYPFLATAAFHLKWYNVVSFSITMTAQGLSYPDRFKM